ncbi:MAG TPA: hypothetical protein VG076_10830 [Acidimicrobiales bacterium]|nr:hypothetical protein [Acidimicrobiales bacterium]
MDPEVEALYGLPLDEFTKARDTLAKARTKELGKEAGAAVKALRKPSVVAWALNQLARRHPTEVEALLEAGGRLRRAQAGALEGGDPDELREATKAEAGEVQALAGQARALLADAGRGGSATQEERLAATLRAAAVDDEAGDRLRRGVLSEELSPAGFGFGVGVGDDLPADLPADFRARKSDSPPSKHESQKAARERARQEAAAERKREQEVRAAQETAARLAREADRAEEKAREARAAAQAAAARAQELEQAEGGPK